MPRTSPAPDLFRPDGSGLQRWWETPILIHRWPDHGSVNAELEVAILDRMSTSGGMARSNVGGLHSSEDVLKWPVAAVGRLKDWIVSGVRTLHHALKVDPPPAKLHLAAWANVNRAGDSNSTHEHGNHVWSGVYYVATGSGDGAAKSGFIEFLDPQSGAGRLNVGLSDLGGSSLIPPEPGLMVMFPSWLLHSVRPHSETGLRISIAFNVAEPP